MNRNAFLATCLVVCAVTTTAAASLRTDLVEEILRRVPEWPGTEVEIPIPVYEQYLRELMQGPVPPQPPEVVWVERAAYRLVPAEKDAQVEATIDLASLPGQGNRSAWVLPADLAWRDVTLNGQPAVLRRADDGWFYADVPGPGPYRLVAKAQVEPKVDGDVRRIEFGTAPAGWTTCSVDAPEAWDVRFSRSPVGIVGAAGGTQGTVGLAVGGRLEVTWQRPQAEVHRAAQMAMESHVGWTLADAVHQVRAVIDVRLWGGEAEELTVSLPPGAERVTIAGSDVRDVQVQGDSARVFLRGAIRQRTRLTVSFEMRRPATGRMTLPAFGVVGAKHRGGTLAIGGGAGGVLLEMASPGLTATALYDLPDGTRALLTAAPVYGYAITGAWEARVDLVSMSEFPVRETLVDSALYTVLYRPDGLVMTKVIYEVRNRAQQYMQVTLPPGAQLVVARVSEEQRNLARGPDGSVYVPLEKSVLTTAGLVSFPVELVYVLRGQALARQGTFRLALPRTDLPVAYARCALMLPDGMQARQWQGVLRQADTWSSETAELEFQYGTGHVAPGARSGPELPEPLAPSRRGKPEPPGLVEVINGLFAPADGAKPSAVRLGDRDEGRPSDVPPAAKPEPLEAAWAAGGILQGKNLYRAGVDYYERQNYEKAGDLFRQVVAVAPKSSEADNARKYLGNIDIAAGKGDADAKGDRGLRAATKAVQKAQQGANVDERETQALLLIRAGEARQRGDQEQAEAAYKVAVDLGARLAARGEEAQEQKARVRGAEEFLAQRRLEREERGQQVVELQTEVATLRESIVQQAGEDVAAAFDTLGTVETDGAVRARSGRFFGETRRGAQPTPQVEVNKALAEQHVQLGFAVAPTGGSAARYGFTGSPQVTVEQLRQQVERLKSVRSELAQPAPVARHGTQSVTAEATVARGRDGLQPDFDRRVSERAQTLAAEANRVTELARQGRLVEAGRLLEGLEEKTDATARAAHALATGMGNRRGSYRDEPGPAPTTPESTVALEHSKRAQRLTTTAQRWGTDAGGELADVRKNLSEAKALIEKRSKELSEVRFDVGDLTGGQVNLNVTDGQKLAEFVASNYSWAMADRPRAAGPAAAGGFGLNGDVATGEQGQVSVSFVDAGTLAVRNDPAAVQQVQAVLERLRLNLGQRVAVASRNFFVDAQAARAAGLRWETGANGVRYAVINEGQLRGLMDVEQRHPGAAAGSGLVRDTYQETVVGTDARLANSGVANVSRAADDANTFSYNGNTVQVTHDDYLVVDNGGYLTAVKSGRMQHWTVEAAPVRFPGVPAAVVVPAVGHTVKFEKTLLDASDTLELIADYTWEGDER
ncbi:MAG TPA: hypothetical protein VM431_10105 [Phycisphaerae bacterium]|nr:hypothetical protein [Phycisphaerae bacterium]